jgi:hypothetical protein
LISSSTCSMRSTMVRSWSPAISVGSLMGYSFSIPLLKT